MKTTSRILSIGMALLLLVCLCTMPAFAEGDDGSATPPVTNTTGDGVYVTAATVTDIAGGEVTTVERDDHVNIVLRVVDHSSAKNNVTADQIVTRINSSIFQYTGTGEISQLIEGTDDGGDYYSYVLLFRDVIYAGGGNTLNIDLSYLDSSMAMQQFAVTIGQCVDEDPKTPNLVMRESSYGTETVTAGNPFTLSVTAYATAGDESLSDVIVSVTLPDGITLTGGSLSEYVGTMSAKSTRDVTFAVLPSASFTGGVANITVNMTGTGTESGTAVTGTGTISVPISQPDRFEITTMELTDTIYVGDTTSVTLNFVNKGKNPISNLEASISGENLGVDVSQQYIGNIAAGTENSVDFDLTPQQAGELSGTITLTYEASDGTTKTLTQDFSATVQEMPVYEDPGMIDPGMVEPEPTGGMPVWGIVLIVVGVVVVVVIVVAVVRKKKKAAALAMLEDGDEDL
ncbi:hypothetical protein INF35_13075 [Subdoligranulum sp. DSM 109015]|uniref:Uncharacterized protein n=1 Tax=Gemmiger gallinarum TaxID=2779354 RepID=A0ABR9R6D8_9FIRM|nr:hypothetical protein [Gemmiger gallinarum]MBE5038721.1 hypothetical protein [Gemmiger gallinarum]